MRNIQNLFIHLFFKVIFGGGRQYFVRDTDKDSEGVLFGKRTDNRNLINEWVENMSKRNLSHEYIWNADQLRNLNTNEKDYVFGKLKFLF